MKEILDEGYSHRLADADDRAHAYKLRQRLIKNRRRVEMQETLLSICVVFVVVSFLVAVALWMGIQE